jgi:hypothetical protein
MGIRFPGREEGSLPPGVFSWHSVEFVLLGRHRVHRVHRAPQPGVRVPARSPNAKRRTAFVFTSTLSPSFQS